MTSARQAWQGLRLDPLDTLFFRDGRPFDAASRAAGGLPTPQPLAGALRTALLAQSKFNFTRFAKLRKDHSATAITEHLRECGAAENVIQTRFRGPWLALAHSNTVEPLLPVPATLACDKNAKQWFRTDPLRNGLPTVGKSGLALLWRRGNPDAKHPGGFLTLEGIRRFLGDARGLPAHEDWLGSDDLYGFEHRTGIAVDPESLTAAEGQIYGISLLALCRRIEKTGEHEGNEVCLYAEVQAPSSPAAFPDPVLLGGEGRQARVEIVKVIDWPQSANRERTLWLLATPAFFPGHKPLPAVLTKDGGQLKAAASAAPLAVSGWDVARNGPRPTRFAVPAGSVYFVEGKNAVQHKSLCTDPEDQAQGWGFALRGEWNYA